ncbi:MAG: D-alanyl-D-alanine carboxypeptidase/D-alanyl-D-alanine-endopeptidase [Bacteroidaceae bacterium]|nr:D-alanyl-D-alanine carboxypeptidase/D-alanyl-D-alanine-endopeptidase [Bacteroidaceae bacterium]
MKKILFYIFSVITLFSCGSSKKVIYTPELQQIQTVYVEKETKNVVTDHEMNLLSLLKQGCRNFNTSPIASDSTWEGRLQVRLQELCASPIFNRSQLGLVVYDITAGKYLFSVNGDHRMRPASCQKLVTAISALSLLGANYSFIPQIDEAGEGWCWDDDITSEMPYLATRKWRMKDVLTPMMKDSDNRLAESLFWQLSKIGGGKFGDLKSVVPNIEKVLQRAGIPKGSGYRIADGSGLSLYNYITPNMLNALLVYAWVEQGIRTHLIPTLPIGGVDGTLKNRFHDTKAYNNIFAKTGTVTGVSSLSGYANGGNGHVLSFCIINQGLERGGIARHFQDLVCKAITEQ